MSKLSHFMMSALGLSALVGACSLTNAPDDPVAPGPGGTTATGGEGGTGGSVGGGGSGGEEPECIEDDDCAMLADECNAGVCDNGKCDTSPLAAGTACGDSTDDGLCNFADQCDGMGVCAPNFAPNGTVCDTCPAGVGQCTGCQDGVCGDCTTFAARQSFTRPSSLAGWATAQGWGLYRHVPVSQSANDPVDFGKWVFGTDGSLVKPYPSMSEVENSEAVTTPFVLPANVQFLSWHVDEGGQGGGPDTKAIDLSIDGGMTWQPLYDCQAPTGPVLPFCVFFNGPRTAAEWDMISIPVPAAIVGQTAQLRFRYNTQDSCCNFERGWFIDQLNVATECACAADTDCAFVEAEDLCGVGACDMTTNECIVGSPANGGMACGATDDTTCDAADVCNAGYCDEAIADFGTACMECMGTVADQCLCTGGGECRDCQYQNFFSDPADLDGWTFDGGWGLYTQAPISMSFTSTVNFGSMFGTDGNRVPPYPGQETETSTALSPSFLIPNQITFTSWHVDEGFQKKIFLTTDGGMTYTPLADCQAGAPLNAFPFCQTVSTDRPANPKDSITLDTSAFAGMSGQLEFRYDTIDSCCGFERGWFIDNMNVGKACY